MRNIRLTLDYDGSNYKGWQFQKHQPSLQQALEDAILALTGEQRRVVAAGRTDAGVHARGQVVNFFLERNMDLYTIRAGLNRHLPRDIAILEAVEAAEDFNARFAALRRVYLYRVATRRNSLYRHMMWLQEQPIDTGLLNPLAEQLLGEHDFGAFARARAQAAHKRCTVYESHWSREGDDWIYRISANRFLHGMVRAIVGTMMDTARGRFSAEEFRQILLSKDRRRAGVAAPPQGLILAEVVYPDSAVG